MIPINGGSRLLWIYYWYSENHILVSPKIYIRYFVAVLIFSKKSGIILLACSLFLFDLITSDINYEEFISPSPWNDLKYYFSNFIVKLLSVPPKTFLEPFDFLGSDTSWIFSPRRKYAGKNQVYYWYWSSFLWFNLSTKITSWISSTRGS